MADNNNNKYTILISGKLDTTSLTKIQVELDKIKDLSIKIASFTVNQAAVKALKANIESQLGTINVNLAGSGGGSLPKTTSNITTSSGGNKTFTEEQIRGNSVLLAQYEKIAQKVREATQGAQARITVETNGAGVITKVNALYSDLANKMRSINFIVTDAGELEQVKSRYVEDNIKKHKEQLAVLEKSKKVVADMNALLKVSNPSSSYTKETQERAANLQRTTGEYGAQLRGGTLLTKEQVDFLDLYTTRGKSAIKVQSSLNTELDKQKNILAAGKSYASNLLEDMKIRSQSVPQVKEAVAQSNELIKTTDVYSQQLAKGIPLTKEQTAAYTKLTESTKLAKTGVGSLGKDTVGWAQEIGVAIKRTIEWSMAMGLVYGSLNQLKQGIAFITELDEHLTNVRIVSGATAESTRNLAFEYNSLAKELGSTTTEIARGSLEFIRQGKSQVETAELIRVSTMQAKLANMDAAQSTEYLTSIMNGFKLESSDMLGVLDKLIILDNNYATSVSEIATAMQRSSLSARLAGISLEELASMVTVVSSVSRQSAESIGESFKTIFARMQAVKIGADTDEEGENISNVEQVLTKYNITLRDSVGEFRDLGDVLDDVASRWSEFGSVAKSEIASTIAGVRQRERLLVLLENYDMVKQAEILTTDAAGLAQERYGIYLESVQGKQQRFKATWEELWLNTLNSGVTKTLLDIGTGLLQLGVNLGGLIPILTTILGLVIALNGATIAGAIVDTGKKIAKFVASMKTASLAVSGFSGALASLGGVLAIVGIAYTIYSAISEAHRKKVEEASKALVDYSETIKTLPEKIKSVSDATSELNELFAKQKSDTLTEEETAKLYAQYDILHSLIPEYEGWHYSKMGWYLDEQIELEKINALLEKQRELSSDDIEAFDTLLKESMKDTTEPRVFSDEVQARKNVKDIVDKATANGEDVNVAVTKYYEDLLVKSADGVASSVEWTIIEHLSNAFMEGTLQAGKFDFASYFEQANELGVDLDAMTEDWDKQIQAAVDKLIPMWANLSQEVKDKYIAKYGATNPIIAGLLSLEADDSNAPTALADQFKSFQDLLARIAENMTGKTQEAFMTFGRSIIDLNKSFEDGKISAVSYFSTLTEQSANHDLIDMFDDGKESAEGFFTALINNGVAAIDSLTAEFYNGDIAITDYMDGLIGASEMLDNYYQTMIDNADVLDMSVEDTNRLTAEYEEHKAILSETTQELINMSETADLLRQGYDSVMGGDMFSQFQSGAESAISYFQSLSDAAWNYAQQSGFAFKDSAGNALTSAEEIYKYMTGSIGSFSNFSTQMTARVNGGIQAQRTAIADSLSNLAKTISTFKVSITAKVIQKPVTFELPKVAQGILGKSSLQFMVPSVVIDASGGIQGDIGAAVSKVVDAFTPEPAPPMTNEIWSGGGGYTPPSPPSGGGGGGGGGKTPEQEAAEAEAKARSEAEKSYQDLLKMTIAMLKDKANRAKDALKDELDAYKKLIKAKKEELDIQKKQRSDTKEINKRTNTVANLEAELAQIQFDTSQEGIARRLELEAQLAEAKTELEDEQFEQRIEAQEEALDIELELYTEYIEAKIEELNTYLEEEGKIVQEAQELIHGKTQAFYDELAEWNMTYGSGIATDIVNAWQGAITWIETFGMQGAAAVETFAGAAGTAISNMASGASTAISGLITDTNNAIASANTLVDALARVAYLNSLGAGIDPTMGGGGDNAPPQYRYHSGGIVGGLPQIPEQEVFAKLLKGEVVSTKEQAYNFIKNTLPNMVATGGGNTGDINVDITIPVSGNLDRSVLPDLERAVSNVMMSIRDNAGLRSSSNFNTI